MSFASRTRKLLPLRLQPPVRYHYERWRGLLERELPLFCSLIKPHDIVVDVGANAGIYVHALRRRGAIVEAFEPQPTCSAVLRAYAAANPGIHVHETALGASVTTARLTVPLDAGRLARGSATLIPVSTAVGETIDVAVRTLDSYRLDPIAAMKIDVEGAELEVLRGATLTIAFARPTLLVEIEQRHHDRPIADVFAYIEGQGYDGAFLLPGRGLRPLAEFDGDEHQRVDEAGRPTGVYINNFLFRARR